MANPIIVPTSTELLLTISIAPVVAVETGIRVESSSNLSVTGDSFLLDNDIAATELGIYVINGSVATLNTYTITGHGDFAFLVEDNSSLKFLGAGTYSGIAKVREFSSVHAEVALGGSTAPGIAGDTGYVDNAGIPIFGVFA